MTPTAYYICLFQIHDKRHAQYEIHDSTKHHDKRHAQFQVMAPIWQKFNHFVKEHLRTVHALLHQWHSEPVTSIMYYCKSGRHRASARTSAA